MHDEDDRDDDRNRDKRIAAEAAVGEVRSGMLVGLGTGSTAAHAIRAIGQAVAAGLRIEAVATSDASAALAQACGIAVRDFADVTMVDLTIDGADQIDPACRAVKGAGGAMLREKVVAAASTRMIVIADGTKRVAALTASVPVEILPFARDSVLARLGDGPTLRLIDGAPWRTDNGNLIADCRFDLSDPADLAAQLSAIPGVLGHGLFLDEVDAAYVAQDGIVTLLERRSGPGLAPVVVSG